MPYKLFSFHYGGKGEEHGIFFVLAGVANEKYNELKDWRDILPHINVGASDVS